MCLKKMQVIIEVCRVKNEISSILPPEVSTVTSLVCNRLKYNHIMYILCHSVEIYRSTPLYTTSLYLPLTLAIFFFRALISVWHTRCIFLTFCLISLLPFADCFPFYVLYTQPFVTCFSRIKIEPTKCQPFVVVYF